MNDTHMFIDRRCGGLRIWMLLVLSCFVLGVPAQSIADLARIWLNSLPIFTDMRCWGGTA